MKDINVYTLVGQLTLACFADWTGKKLIILLLTNGQSIPHLLQLVISFGDISGYIVNRQKSDLVNKEQTREEHR